MNEWAQENQNGGDIFFENVKQNKKKVRFGFWFDEYMQYIYNQCVCVCVCDITICQTTTIGE